MNAVKRRPPLPAGQASQPTISTGVGAAGAYPLL
jgi:hypothetical protein